MKKHLSFILFLLFTVNGFAQNERNVNKSFCNPLDLNYRFRPEEPSRREAADPAVIRYKDKYILFASKTGGYWVSDNLTDWDFITNNVLPWEDYAPAAVATGDTVYFMAYNVAGRFSGIFKSINPLKGEWELVKDSYPFFVGDPDLFLDDDGRLYLFYGLSNFIPVRGVELNRSTLDPVGEPTDLFLSNREEYGWERTGDYNENAHKKPWIEGPWITKVQQKYYMQYAVPGTEFKSYADGVYVADLPLGPYTLQKHNPFSYKPEGFIAGAGHGSTFRDKWGNYWYTGTMTISVKDDYERRLGLFPVFLDRDGVFYAYTGFGDYPHKMPQKKIQSPDDYQPEWMLLSYGKPVEVSSSLESYPKENAVNEDVRTYWSAKTGDKGEWLMVDLLNLVDIYALQINFAEQDTKILGRTDGIYYQYIVEYSADKSNWKTLADKSKNTKDAPHDFVELKNKVTARYIKITNHRVPDGKFAVSGLRVFGFGKGEKPEVVTNINAVRDLEDKCIASLKWNKSADATGYNVRYGTAPDKLYLNYQVYAADSLTIRSLNSDLKYYFTVDAFNENGITKGEIVIEE